MDRASARPKPLEWVGSSKKDLKALPDEVMDVPEKVEVRHQHPEAGHRPDPGKTESGRGSGQGVEK